MNLTESRSTADLIKARGLYLCYYLGIGSFLPFINLYYERIGMSGVQIGTLAALPVLVLSSTSLFWGALSDAFNLHGRILSLALLLSPITVLLLSRSNEYATLVRYVLVYALFSSPIVPLLDSLALKVAKLHQGTFGDLRVWGSIGWSASTLLVGMLIERTEIRIFFYCYAVFMALTFLISLFQPTRSHLSKSPHKYQLWPILRKDILIFLASIFLLATTTSAVNAFFSIYMDQIGASEGSIGLGWALAALSEIPVMIFSGRLMRWIGASGLLKIAFLTYALRWLLFSFISDPRWALSVQLLHGLSFATFLLGGVTYINERVPESLSATAQAAFNTVLFGFGSIVGVLLGGFFYDMTGMATLFRVLSLVALAGLALFWLGTLPRFNFRWIKS